MSPGPERLVVLLGFPLVHSLSPAIHNASFRSQGLPFRYQSHPVPPESLASSLQDLKRAGFAGANVTVPHKQAVVELVDETSEVVDAVGAANTLVWKVTSGETSSGTLYADNTDVGGFLATLEGSPFRDMPCVIFGSGGAARAVAYGMVALTDSPSVTVAARTASRGEELVGALSDFDPHQKLKSTELKAAGDAIRDAGLVVNATPAGMYPHVEESPWHDPHVFHEGQLVYDLIYNPSETRLMAQADARGAEVMGGLQMLIEQAALSYCLWTGRQMDRSATREALNR